MAGNSDKARHTLAPRLFQRADCASRHQRCFEVGHHIYGVDLHEIDLIGLKLLQVLL